MSVVDLNKRVPMYKFICESMKIGCIKDNIHKLSKGQFDLEFSEFDLILKRIVAK